MFSIKQKQNNWPTVVALVCLVSCNVLLLFGFLLKYTNQCFKKNLTRLNANCSKTQVKVSGHLFFFQCRLDVPRPPCQTTEQQMQ